MNRKVWGHRGCRGAGHPPENSIGAFQTAIEAGAGGIELDVQLSKDGVPVVFHDETLQRMTGVERELASLTLLEIKSLRLLTPEGRVSKETIPLLEDALDLVGRCRQSSPSFVLNIELKDPRAVPAVASLILQRIANGWDHKNFVVSSFEMGCLREIKALLPGVPLGTLFECTAEDLASKMEQTADLRPATINIPITSLTSATFNLITASGAIPVVWTPHETNPNQLPQLEREKLVANLRDREFVAITDFPKELLPLLKPNITRATFTGVLAACLAFTQQDMLFRPSESGLESLKSPSEYPELKRFGFRELTMTAEDGVSFTVWERKGALDRPHFLLFHGNRAHWGDTGVGDALRDRRARLKFIEELASSGAGVSAVTLRGFGKSSAIPSETGFLRDLRAIDEHLALSGINHQRLVVAGESLGTWAATQTAVYMTQRNAPPALLSLQNPFTSAAEVGERVVSHFLIVRSLNIALSASALDRHVLKSHFYTADLFPELSAGTLIHIGTSGRDDLVHPSHSDRLAEIAQRQNLRVVRDLFPEALHGSIPPIEYARRLISLGVQSCGGISDVGQLWSGLVRPMTSVDYLLYF